MAFARAEKNRAGELIKTLLVLGVGLGLIGGVMMGFAWPGTKPEEFGGGVVKTGSAWGVILGALVAWLGNSVLFVALVAVGVKLGRQASPTLPERFSR